MPSSRPRFINRGSIIHRKSRHRPAHQPAHLPQGPRSTPCLFSWGTLRACLLSGALVCSGGQRQPERAHSLPFRLAASPMRRQSGVTTLSACGLDQIHPGTHRAQQTQAHTQLALRARRVRAPYRGRAPWPLPKISRDLPGFPPHTPGTCPHFMTPVEGRQHNDMRKLLRCKLILFNAST